MPRFTFKLEPVLKARKREEQERQRAVAGIEAERLRLEQTLRLHQANIAAGKDALRAGLVGRLDPGVLRLEAAGTMQVLRKAQQTLIELAGLHKRLEAARAELVEASRRRRAMELLREQRMAQWISDMNRAETKATDELAVIHAARAAREEF